MSTPRCRKTRPIFSSGTPSRSISVAAVWRSACAPLKGVTTPARFMTRLTSDEMPSLVLNGRHGAIVSPSSNSSAELDRLIEVALQLRPRGDLRAQTYATLIALLAATGLRIA